MKISTKLIITFSFLLGIFIFLCICPNNNVKAITQAQAGQAIAEFALNTANNHAAETIYVSPEEDIYNGIKDYYRSNSYKGIRSYKYNGTMLYGFDCNGFVSFVVHNALGIGKETFTKFVVPQTEQYKWIPNTSDFEVVASGLSNIEQVLQRAQPGDLIASAGKNKEEKETEEKEETHVQIYVGNGKVVDCAAKHPEAVQIREKNRILHINDDIVRFTILRITEEAAQQVTEVKQWVDEPGVVREDLKEYYDQNGEKIIKNEDGTYQYEDGRKIYYKDGQYVDEEGNVVIIESTNLVVNEITGEVIGTIKDILEEDMFQGILKIERTTPRQGTRNLKYINLDELKKKAEANDETALEYFSLNGDALVVAKSEEFTLNSNGQAGTPETKIELLSIEYKTIVAKYSMPFEFQLALQTISQNPEFVLELANLQREGEIVLTLQDYTVIDTTVYESETYTYKQNRNSGDAIIDPSTTYYKEETIIKTVTPVLNVKSADTWIYKVENTFTTTNTKEGGDPEVTNLEPRRYNIYDENGETLVSEEVKITNTNTVEKITWNKGTSNKESKEDLVLPLFRQMYDIPNSNTDNQAGGQLISGAEMLFSLLESSEETQEHAIIMRYLLYKYSNKEKYYGVTSLDFTTLEEKFYTLEDNTTYNQYYDSAEYTSYVDTEGSIEGRSVAAVAEYFIRVGNAKNLLIYSQDSNRSKGFKFELASGTTEDRKQQTPYKDKLVYDCSSFVSAMYNLVFGVPTYAWTTSAFDKYKDEDINGSKNYFYCVGKYSEVKDQLQPGDILMADKNMGNKYDHAMIYIGNGRIAHASSSNDLEISNVWSSTNYVLRLKPNAVTNINMKVTWPDGTSETVSLSGGGTSTGGTGGTGGSGGSGGSSSSGGSIDNSAYLTMDETELLERVVAAEARGEPYEGQVAVAAVALNRLEVKHGGKTTLREILLAPEQFAAPYTGQVPQSVKYAVQDAINGEDPTKTILMLRGALYFNAMSREASWYTSRCSFKVKVIGNHVFYREYKPWNN